MNQHFLALIFLISKYGQALFATKVMVILSLALSVFNVKHEIKMIQYTLSKNSSWLKFMMQTSMHKYLSLGVCSI